MARSFRKEIKEPDAFHRWADRVVEWYKANRRNALRAAAGILVIAVAAGGYRLWTDHMDRQAALSLATADIVSQDPLSPQVEQALRRTAENYPSTRSGVIARLRLAGLLRDRDDAPGAEKEYRGLLETGAFTDTDRELARRGLAGSLALQGKCAEAIPIWRDILAKGSLITSEDIYLSLGDCYETAQQPAEALKIYEELIQKHPASPFITPALRARMERLK